jgi:hypothetical protein
MYYKSNLNGKYDVTVIHIKLDLYKTILNINLYYR